MDRLKAPLSSNTLKLLALILMTLDHIYVYLFPDLNIFHIIGRLSFPIFAYMIAEGCTYTRDPKKYFLSVFSIGLLCQLVFFITVHSLYQSVFITFSFSIILIFSVKGAEEKGGFYVLVPFFVSCAIFFIANVIPHIFPASDFHIDYGFCGIFLPLFAYLPKKRVQKLLFFSLGLLLLAIDCGGYQYWSLFALPLLILYNGKRGKLRIKYLFYIYYPLHFAALYLIKELMV